MSHKTETLKQTEGECSRDLRKALLPAFIVMCSKMQAYLLQPEKKLGGKLKIH
jgi:hypothetical protein